MLTLRQQQAIAAKPDEHTAVIAPAGSGKTFVIEMRIQWLLHHKLAEPSDILVITFMRNAALTLNTRISIRLGLQGAHSGVAIGTFHAQAAELQTEEKQDRLAHVDETVVYFLQAIERGQIHHFKHVIVDEFQDTDALQCRVLEAFADRGSKIYEVGDPNQLIYGFRGSDIDLITEHVAKLNPNIIYLDANFRSTPEIVAFANACAAKNNLNADDWRKEMPAMCAMSDIGDRYLGFRKPLIVDCDSLDMELNYIVKQIRAFKESYQPIAGSIQYHDIALLFKTNAALGRAQTALFKNKIPSAVLNMTSGMKKNHVQLYTVYGAKGLEFPVVFVVGVSSKTWPDARSSLREERDVFYVAITRAQRFLIITHDAKNPCLFVAELEAKVGLCNTWLFNRVSTSGALVRHIIVPNPRTGKPCAPGEAAEILKRQFVQKRELNRRTPETKLSKKIESLNGLDYVHIKTNLLVPNWKTQVYEQLPPEFVDNESGFVFPAWAETLKTEVVELLKLAFDALLCVSMGKPIVFPRVGSCLSQKKPYALAAGFLTKWENAHRSLRLMKERVLTWKASLPWFWELSRCLTVYGGTRLSLEFEIDLAQLCELIPHLNAMEQKFANLQQCRFENVFHHPISFGTLQLGTEATAIVGGAMCICYPTAVPGQGDSLAVEIVRAHASLALWRTTSELPISRMFLFDLLRPLWITLDLTEWNYHQSNELLAFFVEKNTVNRKRRRR